MKHAALVLVATMMCAASPFAQSLGDLARKEEQRRKVVSPGKVYTNDDLRSAPAPPPAPAATASAADQPAADKDKAAAADKDKPSGDKAAAAPAADTVKKDEAYWRGRLQAERDALERAKVLLDALQGRVNGLQTDFINRDDPAARAVVTAERQRALAELDRTKLEITQRTKAIAEIQEEARRSGAPAGWYR
jgi:hypothetical protein